LNDGRAPHGAAQWWAHLVGVLRVHPHKHWANYPPQEVRGAADCRRVVSFSKRRTRAAERAFTREHPMAPL